MKKSIIFICLLFSISAPAFAQVDVDVLVRNQRFHADTFFFDIYLNSTGNENLFLGHSDFSLHFNEAYFNSPTLNMVTGSTQLVNAFGAPTNYYDTNIGYELKYTGINAYKMMVYLNMPVYSNSTQFYQRVARIDAQPLVHRIGTFYLTNATDLNTNPQLTWVTNGKGLVLNVIHRDSATLAADPANITGVNPQLEAEPVVQASNLTITSSSNNSLSLSWTSGNGSARMLLARRTDNSTAEFPSDGIIYTANSLIGAGSQLGNSGTYVVYQGTGNSATVSGLNSATDYTFYVLEMDGANGWSENYNVAGIDSVSGVTDDNFVTANVKVFLQGPYNTVTGLMNNHLRMGNSFGSTNLVPAAQPYSGAPWNYAGTENVDTSKHPANLVDWILVELRSSYNGAAVARRAAFLLTDGSIVDTNGVDPLQFSGLPYGKYYIVLKHRNHLPIMTRDSISLTSSSSLYNFTNGGQGSAYGTDTTLFRNMPMSSLGSGIYGMRAGDAGGTVVYQIRYNGGGQNDRVSLLTFVGGGGSSSVPKNNLYSRNDVNMDRQVRYNGGGQNDRVRLQNYVGGTASSSVPISTQVPNP